METTKRSQTEIEIAGQPEAWRRAAELARASSALLPRPGERVAVIGCGTSLYMAQAYAARREACGAGETDAFAASEAPPGRRYERVLAITRSGTTSEVLAALARWPADAPTVAVTADAGAAVAGIAGEVIALEFADERSVVQTRFATSALLLLRAHLGENVERIVADCEQALEEPLPEEALERSQFTFLGRGWTVGLANEAALKLREAAGAWTESYPAMEYRHGPISVADGRSVVWLLGPPPKGLVAEIGRTGAVAVTSLLDPLADLVRAQRLAVALARARDLDPDRPRNLTRSVILSD
jgi:fructoselysine-6-P-deglycase FrlB-like protein